MISKPIFHNTIVKRYNIRNGMAFIILNTGTVLKTRNAKLMKVLYPGKIIPSLTINNSCWIKDFELDEIKKLEV